MTKKICDECEHHHVIQKRGEFCARQINIRTAFAIRDGLISDIPRLKPPRSECRDFKKRR